MTYSISQINNLIRTYAQQLRPKPAPPGDRAPLPSSARGADQVSISPEGKRLADAATSRQTPTK